MLVFGQTSKATVKALIREGFRQGKDVAGLLKGPRMSPRGGVNRRFWKLTPLNAKTIRKEKLQIKITTTPHKLATE